MATVVTFDLHNANAGKYDEAHAILAQLGFVQWFQTQAGQPMPLPEATAMGERPEGALVLRDLIWQRFAAAGLNPKRIFVADFASWGAYSVA